MKFGEATLSYIVHQLATKEELKELKEAFNVLDKNKDGNINIKELREGIDSSKFSYQILQTSESIFEKADIDHNGYISYDGYIITQNFY